jgi:lysophospholipase L1-like esterase
VLARSTAFLLLVACASGGGDTTTTTAPAGIRYLALGDSYTIGESVAAADRWPEVLARTLEADVGPVSVEIIARTGWTTSELAAAIDAANPQGPCDVVTLLIGVNDQYRGLSIGGYSDDFAALLDRAIGLAGGDPSRVIVVSIPDWGVTPFAGGSDRTRIATEIDAFNEVAERITARAGVAWVDVTTISRSETPGLVADDGLHPSAAQYRLWVEAILPAALDALGTPGADAS